MITLAYKQTYPISIRIMCFKYFTGISQELSSPNFVRYTQFHNHR
jgi:hypothetical protein